MKKPISIKYTEEQSKIVGEFKLNTQDFKLPDAEYMGIGVEKEVTGKVIIQI